MSKRPPARERGKEGVQQLGLEQRSERAPADVQARVGSQRDQLAERESETLCLGRRPGPHQHRPRAQPETLTRLEESPDALAYQKARWFTCEPALNAPRPWLTRVHPQRPPLLPRSQTLMDHAGASRARIAHWAGRSDLTATRAPAHSSASPLPTLSSAG